MNITWSRLGQSIFITLFLTFFGVGLAKAQIGKQFIPLVLDDETVVVPDFQPIGSDTSDWSVLLDDAWSCGGQMGPHWEQWKKGVLLFAATSGYSFGAFCGGIKLTGVPVKPDQPGNVQVLFRDENNYLQYVGWYSPWSDRIGYKHASGIAPMHSQRTYLPDGYTVGSDGTYSGFPKAVVERGCHPLPSMDNPHWDSCIGKARTIENEYDTSSVIISSETLDGTSHAHLHQANTDVTIEISYIDDDGPPSYIGFSKAVVTTIVCYYLGLEVARGIGVFEAGSVGEAALATGVSNFAQNMYYGGDLEESLFEGIKAAATAGAVTYVGKMVVNTFGEPGSLVGVAGEGCPRGDQCWYFQMANGVPPLKRLAELHDPFIDFSVKAFGTLADNPFYKAVTIPPFLIPGCMASNGCTAVGILLTRADEWQ